MRWRNLKQLLILLLFTGANAQKQEIRSALRELKEGYPQRALTSISGLEYKILNATDEEKSDYYYITGICNLMQTEKSNDKKGLSTAVQAFNDLLVTENSTKLFKYSEVAKEALYGIKRKLANQAAVNFKEEKYQESGNIFLDLYQFDKNQMCYLYYAAYCNMLMKKYSNALNYFTELKKKNYSGKIFFYYAVNNTSGKDDEFLSRSERDKALTAGTHKRSYAEMSEPKKENILNNIILLNLLLGNAENAKRAIMEYKIREPQNPMFDLAEFLLYLETKDYQTFDKILLARLVKNPDDADLYFYLGVISERLNKKKDAKIYYKRVLEINPVYQLESEARLSSSAEAERIFSNLGEKISLTDTSEFNP
ncbi:hypothetical protein B0A81_18680 [Flavobacterium plurextorum]|uniref:Tetratricopeptide repeat protein n=1 Tax=Flavobacterium plurextorum TaxID=1114867 RepID=A0ABX4CQD5_9FLAO|nr:tetratricopeptide repeat protein [Flavobacterium plurextorum]OXB03357.1 hypothetical protein B0A81_18680 [Flavobacterium plurextorum]